MSSNITNVLIGIQARSTSTRFPNKAMELIGGKPMIAHVISACKNSEQYLNRHVGSNGLMVNVALLTPTGDPLANGFRRGIRVIEGPEHDVLARYALACENFQSDYIVRVTGDCPLIPPFIIAKCIKTAVMNQYDYFSNVDEGARTFADGMDCEVISSRLLRFTDENATDATDRQHVTTFIRRSPPYWAQIGHMVGYMDLSGIKLSVDTPEDLERVRAEYDSIKSKIAKAEKAAGGRNVHRV